MPPCILRANYDVPLPSLEDIVPSCSSESHSAENFISLCSLSEILGDILPLVYDISTNPQNNIGKKLRQLDVDLDKWEEVLPEWLRDSLATPIKPIIAGSSNLQLAALAIKLLICRIRLRVCLIPNSRFFLVLSTDSSKEANFTGREERATYYRSECFQVALTVVNFTLALDIDHWHDFWLPCKINFIVT